MNVREYINKHPMTSTGVLVALIALGVIYAFFSLNQTSQNSDQTKAFFTIDDGTTWFADAYDKPSGFLKDGKPAYAVNVYAKGSGKPFVGFLRKSGAPQATVAPTPPAQPAAAALPKTAIPGSSALLNAVDKEEFLKKSQSAGQVAPPAPGGMVDPNSVESYVKKPGEKDWHPLSSAEGRAIMAAYGPQAQLQGLQVVTP